MRDQTWIPGLQGEVAGGPPPHLTRFWQSWSSRRSWPWRRSCLGTGSPGEWQRASQRHTGGHPRGRPPPSWGRRASEKGGRTRRCRSGRSWGRGGETACIGPGLTWGPPPWMWAPADGLGAQQGRVRRAPARLRKDLDADTWGKESCGQIHNLRGSVTSAALLFHLQQTFCTIFLHHSVPRKFHSASEFVLGFCFFVFAF